MTTSVHPRENGANFATRRGHYPQLSISDDNHHVTEAIGYMYDDEEEADIQRRSGGEQHNYNNGYPRNGVVASMPVEAHPARRTSVPRKRVPDSSHLMNGNVIMGPASHARSPPLNTNSWDRQQQRGITASPPLGTRERAPSDTATSPFPLNDIDYESSPAAVAQELSNLQALRRMSMDVGAAGDPDLPALNAAAMPSMPSATASEDDSSRLFWVPARLHPELAPKEFKSFLDSKAEQIKRRSGELSQFTSPTSSRSSSLSIESGSGGGLQRKKSMLSRQINNSVGYQDGADRLERKRSEATGSSSPDPNLEELGTLVSGTQRMSLEGQPAEEGGDIILPSVPGSSLKRSTRTNYRRGGSVKGRQDRSTYAQRMARRQAGGGDTPTSPAPDVPPLPSFTTSDIGNLAETLGSPSMSPLISGSKPALNFSRPAGRTSSLPPNEKPPPAVTFDNIFHQDDESTIRYSTASMPERRPEPMSQQQLHSSGSLNRGQVPQIVEHPPIDDDLAQRPASAPSPVQPPARHPERSSSRDAKVQPPQPPQPVQRPGMPPKQNSSIGPPAPTRTGAVSPPSAFRQQQPQSLEQPSPLPGNNTNTTELSFIPTLTVDKRADNKKEQKKSGWGWLLGKEDDKDKPEKPKSKGSKSPDNTRLDVLQTSIDGKQGRESIVLDRDSLKLEEERKKESARKSSSSEGKKEKESIFSSIFGGKKSKAEKETSKKFRDRLSPEPAYRELKPDIDYHWTRFSILEERAIYRMAHIKLANPRRALYSQVLLSNFMYSYLAKVQQMHPQMNLPTSAKQQRKQQQKEQQAAPVQQQQPDEFVQYQRYQQVSVKHGHREKC